MLGNFEEKLEQWIWVEFIFENIVPKFDWSHAKVLTALLNAHELNSQTLWVESEIDQKNFFKTLDFLLQLGLVKKTFIETDFLYSLGNVQTIFNQFFVKQTELLEAKQRIWNEICRATTSPNPHKIWETLALQPLSIQNPFIETSKRKLKMKEFA